MNGKSAKSRFILVAEQAPAGSSLPRPKIRRYSLTRLQVGTAGRVGPASGRGRAHERVAVTGSL